MRINKKRNCACKASSVPTGNGAFKLGGQGRVRMTGTVSAKSHRPPRNRHRRKGKETLTPRGRGPVGLFLFFRTFLFLGSSPVTVLISLTGINFISRNSGLRRTPSWPPRPGDALGFRGSPVFPGSRSPTCRRARGSCGFCDCFLSPEVTGVVFWCNFSKSVFPGN